MFECLWSRSIIDVEVLEYKEVFMPFGDERGPLGGGGGAGSGRGAGRGLGGGNRAGAGPAGNCVCPSCGETVSHGQGTPCNSIKCPKCGAQMIRQ